MTKMALATSVLLGGGWWLAARAGEALPSPIGKGPYYFDGPISRAVLERYLARSLHMLGLADSKQLEEDLRMIKHVGAKHIGRVAAIWWSNPAGKETGVADIEAHFEQAKKVAALLHQTGPDLMLQACIFETVSPGIQKIPIPAWAFEALGAKVEARNFDHRKMAYADGFTGHGHGCLPPDMSKPEAQLWFYYCGRRYIDAGFENIHVGMVEHMDRKDPGHVHWFEVLGKLRQYAATRARRHLVLFDTMMCSGGAVEGGKLLPDYHSMTMRPKDVVGSPQKCILEMGYGDTMWGRSKGGLTPSGWTCEHLPYLVELDNGYSPGKGGQNIGFPYAWGYDEISWYAHQDEAYRNEWLRYAWNWIREHDSNGHLQMQGSKCLSDPVNGLNWYHANTKSQACPGGFNQEETIKALWAQAGAAK